MKLKEYIQKLNQLTVDHPECMDFTVITAADDEGNGFNVVHYAPGLGEFEDGEFDNDSENPNAICLN